MSGRAPEGVGTESLLLAAVVVVQALVNWHFASQSFFYADDWVGFQDALSGRYTPAWLFQIHGGHLSPGRRASFLFIQFHANLSWDFALGLLLVAQSISVILVQRILRLLFGARWWTLAVALAYGLSIVVQPSLQWFSAGILIAPSTMCGLAAIHGYLCWWRTGRRIWLVWSAVAVAGGLLFYIKALLVPLYLLAIRVFLLEPERRLRDSARGAAREWWIWAVYAIPVGGALLVYAAQGAQSGESIQLHTVLDYFRTAWTAGFVPSLFGVRVPILGDPTFHAVATTGCQVALVAVAAYTIALRRSAWRPWALLVFVFALNAALVVPRLGLGASIGYALRYYAETTYFAAIAIPFAFARPARRGEPAVAEGWLPPRAAVLAPALGALALYAAFAWASDAAFTRHWPGRTARTWARNAQADLDALRRREPHPVLLDGAVPSDVLPFWVQPGRLPPTNSLMAILGVFEPGLRFDEVTRRTYRVREDGRVERVTFRPVAGAAAAPRCLGGTGAATAGWRPDRPLRGSGWYLQARYRTGPGAVVGLGIDRGGGYPATDERALAPRPAGGTALVALDAISAGTPTIAGLRIRVPAGRRACFTRFAVGSYTTMS